ncbi:MAG: tetratricopeptide repeat-containing serine/threonine-protein kinase, partial [Gemmatimonadota bacterium]|nr:tetratricopeptide repeat-containing serine/threonine-protein kinase [Gemmatimonadota bacterium]
YAFGVMAYEMVTGQPPFVGATPQAVLAAHVTEAPVNVTQRRTTIPPALAELIMRCLAKKPADRPQSAEELLPVLEGLTTPSGGITPTGTQPAAAVERRSHPLRVAGAFVLGSIGVLVLVYVLVIQLALPGWVFVSAIALLLVGLPVMLVAGTRGRPRVLVGLGLAFGALTLTAAGYALTGAMGIGPAATLLSTGALERNDRLILADFVNRTSDSTLGLSITTALRIDLAESPAFELVGREEVAQALQRAQYPPDTALDVNLALAIAEREGIKAVIAGEVAPLGSGYVISARVLASADSTTHAPVRETASDDGEVIEALDRVSKRLRERIGESLRTIRESEGLPRVTTSSLEALRLYAQAIQAADRDGDEARAVSLLEEAVSHDTTFVMAYRRLGVSLYNLGRDRDRRNDALTRAFNLRDRVSNLERYNVISMYRWIVERDLESAIAAVRAMNEIAPRYYLNNLGYLYGQARDWARAEDAYHRGSEASPNTPLIWGGLRNMQFALGKFDATRATIDSFASRFPEHTSADRGPIWFATAMRDFSTAEELLAQYRAKHRDRPARLAWASMQESQLAQMRGKLRDAERHLRDLLAIQVQEGWTDRALWTSMDVAWIEAWFRNDKPRAAALLDTALRRYPLDGVALADRPYLRMADAWAYFGRPDQARGVLAEYERVVDPAIREGAPFEYGVRGQIALAEGRPN